MSVATFNYSVRDRSGNLVSGTLDAESSTAVARRLKSMGYAPVSITEANAGLSKELKIPGFSGGKKIKLKDLAIFARQFATMINSGLSLLRALTILTEQTDNKKLAEVIGEVRNDVQSGNSLSGAMGKHPKVFPPLMINMAKAGEIGGFLDSVLLQVAANFESEVKLRGKIKSAMTYPMVVLFIAILAVLGMLLFIVPTFAKMFKSLGASLPAPTQLLVNASHILKVGFPVFIILGIVGFVVWGKVKYSDQVRNFVDPLKLKMPVFGSLFQKTALARFAGTLSMLLRSGVPILQALDIVSDTVNNRVIAKAVNDVQASVREGESMAKPLGRHKVFPPMVVQMLAVGEETGQVDVMLEKVANFYNQEVEASVDALTSLIEPLLIAVIGGAVGAAVIALYMPMFNIIKLIK